MNRAKFINSIKESIQHRNFIQLLRPFLASIHRYKLKRGYYINRVKSYFFNSLDAMEYNIITPSYKIEFNDKERIFLDEKVYCERDLNKLETQREVFSCILNNVKFYGMSGGISYENKAIVESFFNLNRLKDSICIDSFIFKHRYMKGIYSSIMHLDWAKKNIFHWLIDCLPRLYAITRYNNIRINLIVNSDIEKKQMELLKFFLDHRFRLISINSNEVWTIERFIFPSFVSANCSGFIPKKYLDFIKENIIKGFSIQAAHNKNRIYVSRKKVAKRRLKNEKEIYDLLEKYNFSIIYPEDLSYKEQVETYYSAEILISVHGAGLTNIIFSDNLKVLEIFPPKKIKTHYFMLCKALSFNYKYVIGFNQNPKNEDFEVDKNQVEVIIKEFLQE